MSVDQFLPFGAVAPGASGSLAGQFLEQAVISAVQSCPGSPQPARQARLAGKVLRGEALLLRRGERIPLPPLGLDQTLATLLKIAAVRNNPRLSVDLRQSDKQLHGFFRQWKIVGLTETGAQLFRLDVATAR